MFLFPKLASFPCNLFLVLIQLALLPLRITFKFVKADVIGLFVKALRVFFSDFLQVLFRGSCLYLSIFFHFDLMQ